jgi:lipopolysaccharide biosynthesis glycosyltransferase
MTRPPHPLVLVCGADDTFAKPLAVTLHSALSNYHGEADLSVYIVDGGITQANRSRIDGVLRKRALIEWIQPDLDRVRQLSVSDRYPVSVYLRLLLPSLLPSWIEKAIYLDSDLIIEENLEGLWKVDVSQHAVLAVQDEGAPTVGSPWGLSNYRELGLHPATKYFNSGVLVLNVRRWRERRIADRILGYIAAHPDSMRFGEQDAMNAVLANDWRPLDPKWNQLVSPWEGHDGREYRAGILHFVSRFKPWKPDGAHWTNFIYDRYLKQSGWYNTLQWWSYYVPLLIRRQQVLHVRSTRREAGQYHPPAKAVPDSVSLT